MEQLCGGTVNFEDKKNLNKYFFPLNGFQSLSQQAGHLHYAQVGASAVVLRSTALSHLRAADERLPRGQSWAPGPGRCAT
jgi:hypothetical protein